MKIKWRAFGQDRRKWLEMTWFTSAVFIAFYAAAVIRPLHAWRRFATEHGAALAAVEQNRSWLVASSSTRNSPLAVGVVGGVPGEYPRSAPLMTYSSTSEELADRKLVRTSSIDLLVKHPAESAETIRSLTERVGGFLVKSQTNGTHNARNASLTLRVPAARFQEVEAEIRKLGLRVESEQMNAEDVTKQYVDQQARLHNLRAQEAQYLTILKQAKTVKDTLDISEKLNAVRGEIEQQQAEFDTLSKQAETVAITVSLHSEAEANVFGLHWRPLYELKLAAIEGLQGLTDYATAMFAVVFYLPAILLWLGTILVGAALGWKALRLVVRVLFAGKTAARVPA